MPTPEQIIGADAVKLLAAEGYDVLRNVSGLVSRTIAGRAEFTAADLKKELPGVEAKELQNALAYLARNGRIRRIGYGRYAMN